MTITKFGHSCLLIEDQNARILLDPGIFTKLPDRLERLDGLLLSHEHPDHADPATLQRLRRAQPDLRIITNQAVADVLGGHNIQSEVFQSQQEVRIGPVLVRFLGTTHAVILPEVPTVANTGYLIDGRLFFPGDAFTVPEEPVEILALPVAAPWSKLAETIAYARAVQPKIVIPIHDGFLTPINPFAIWIKKTLPAAGIKVLTLPEGQPRLLS